MLFASAGNNHAYGIPFNWNADYANGKNYAEYDPLTHKKNDFYLIQKNQVIRFGLFGQGMKLFFEMSDGSFNLNGRRIEIEYIDEHSESYNLTTNFADKDLITYKEAYADYNNVQGIQQSKIKSINFGYKTIFKKDGVQFFLQPIVSLPLEDENPFIEVKLTSNKTMNGHLVFKSRGVEIERFPAPLEVNKAGQLNWTIK
ncbi:hypothetical protein ACNA06_01100 [Lysinibacillus sp. RSDA_15]|uniref:hypothetical protein n=1 Tax=Lysinibacillus TaxID=400634 RepID=UPI00056538B9|nr:hypothetical protein [Lysinibacillus sphaericus]MBG9757524.1 hypothetical protein [Lysinibacillus sphaericus]QPA55692.1 hypothetical protein INQ53_06675 [Lysinibacillus sphaericus]QTB14864.1 hypothetical protein J2B92_06520 [Lysinibacillus sphaericus]